MRGPVSTGKADGADLPSAAGRDRQSRGSAAMGSMQGIEPPLARRLRGLPVRTVLGHEVVVAESYLSRLLGLALLTRESAPRGLLLPDCRGVHTLGMRFAIDVIFLDSDGRRLRGELAVPAGRFVADRLARAVLELPTVAVRPRPS